MKKILITLVAIVAASGILSSSAIAHHGPGQFRGGEVTVTGKITNIRFVNPHAYIYLNVINDEGDSEAWRFEMQAGSLLRRAGWNEEMFQNGEELTITGAAGTREKTAALYQSGVFADGSELGRSTQKREVVDNALEVESRMASGTLNLNGTWAAPQRALDPTEAARRAARNAAGAGGMGAGGGGRNALPNGVTALTEAGEESVARYNEAGGGNPRHRCEATNIFFDWTFDRHVNEIVQTEDTITMKYGLMDLVRTIHLDMEEHPENITPSHAGHSIGRLEDNVLHVDTIGFINDGYLSGSLLHSDQFQVTETFTYNDENHSLTRKYSAVDPANFTGTYAGEDMVYISNTPFEDYDCVELMDDYINPIEE